MLRASLLLPLLLAACAHSTPPPPGPAPGAPGGTCDAGAASFSVGRLATEALVAEARQRAGATRARVLRPGQVVTMEFDPGRLNLDVDAAGRVTRVRCG